MGLREEVFITVSLSCSFEKQLVKRVVYK